MKKQGMSVLGNNEMSDFGVDEYGDSCFRQVMRQYRA